MAIEIKTNTGDCPEGCPNIKAYLKTIKKSVRGTTVKTIVILNCEHADVCKLRVSE